MLPDIRAVSAAIVAATSLMITAFATVAMFRVAQEARVASLQADLAQRSQAATPEPRPIVVIETPGPTMLVKAFAVKPSAAAPEDAASAGLPLTQQDDPALPVTAAVLDSPPIAEVLPDREADSLPVAAQDAPLQGWDAQPKPRSPAPGLAIGGPSPEEIADAKARRKAAERARVRKAAAEKARKARAARLAREKAAARRAAEARAKQQAGSSTPQGGFGFNPAGAFNAAPFGSSSNFGSATNWR
jgi:hypothetical protein